MLRIISILCGLIILASSGAFAEKAQPPRLLALVIGNASYSGDSSLPGADKDAEDIASLLAGEGFEIVNRQNFKNLGRAAMAGAIRSFADKIDGNTIAVVYYSGHGIEDQNQNYLVPVDANIQNVNDIQLQLIALDGIIRQLNRQEAKAAIIILDACRNMPMALKFKSTNSGGLREVVDFKHGMRIVFAASPGKTAMAAAPGQRNSVFTASLLNAAREDLSTFNDVLNRAAELTLEATDGRQAPWISGSLGMSFRIRSHGPSVDSPPKSVTRRECFIFNQIEHCQ